MENEEWKFTIEKTHFLSFDDKLVGNNIYIQHSDDVIAVALVD